jgi:hypothetical protein
MLADIFAEPWPGSASAAAYQVAIEVHWFNLKERRRR